LKNQAKNVRYWSRFKEVRIAAIITLFNMEIVVIPFILKGFLGLKGVALKVSAGSWATVELAFWYWFSGWVLKKMRESKPVTEAVLIRRSIDREEFIEVRNTTLVQRLDNWVYEHIIGRFDPESNSRRKLFAFLKGLGYAFGLPAIFMVSIFPVIWIVPFTLCRWTNWKLGVFVVFVANFLRNVGFAEGWDYIWTLF